MNVLARFADIDADLSGLQCPRCGSVSNEVKDTRSRDNAIMRRRRCSQCGTRYKTYERHAVASPEDHAVLIERADRLIRDVQSTVSLIKQILAEEQ